MNTTILTKDQLQTLSGTHIDQHLAFSDGADENSPLSDDQSNFVMPQLDDDDMDESSSPDEGDDKEEELHEQV